MDPPHPHSSSLHSILLSVFIILGILFVAISITISISFLIRCLRSRSLLPPPLSSLIRRLCDAPRSLLPPSLGDCAICLSPLKPEDRLRHLPLCLHAFHADCVGVWLVSNKTCPLCRSPLDHTAADTTEAASSIAADVGHDGSRSWLRDLSRGVSSCALSFRSSSSFFTGSSRRGGTVAAAVVDLEAGEDIGDYFWWLSTV